MPSELIQVEARLRDLISSKFAEMEANVSKSTDRLKNKVNENTKATSGMGKVVKGVSSDIANFAKRFGPAAIAVAGLTAGVMKLRSGLTLIREATEGFEKTMSRAKAIIEPTQDDFDALSNKAKQLGSATAFTASQAGDAFVELGKLGLKTNEILKSSADVLSIAAAADVDLSTAAISTAQTLKQFSLDAGQAQRVTDVMAKSFTSSALDMAKFSESMKFAGPVAAQMGFSLEEATAAIATLAQQGIHGSMAGTAMRRIMLQLGDASSQAGKMIGLTADDTRTLAERLTDLQAHNLSPGQIKDTFGLLATTSASILIKGSENVKEFDTLLQGAEGTAQRMADTMLDNVAGATIKLKSAQEGLAIAIGEAFGATKQDRIEFTIKIVNRLKQVVLENRETFLELGRSVNDSAKAFAQVAGVIATQVIKHLDTLVSLGKNLLLAMAVSKIVAIGTAFKTAGLGVAAFGTKLKALNINPIIMSLTALGLAVDKIIGNMEELAEKRMDISWMDDPKRVRRAAQIAEEYGKIRMSGESLRINMGMGVTALSEAGIKAKKLSDEFAEITNHTEAFDINQGSTIRRLRTIATITDKLSAKEKEKAEQAKKNAEQVAKEQELARQKAAKAAQAKAVNDEAAAKAKAAKEAAQKLQDDLYVMTLEGQDRELAQLQLWVLEKQAILQAANADEGVLIESFEAKKEAIEEKYRKERAKKAQKAVNERRKLQEKEEKRFLKLQEQRREARKETADIAINTLSQVLGAIKLSAGKQKAVAKGEAIVQGALAVTRALGSAPPPFNFIQAGLVTAATAAQVAKIQQQGFQSGGFPIGKNAMIRVNESGQESVLNARATANLGVGGVNALNSGQTINKNVTNEITYSPSININAESSGDLIDVLKNDKEDFASFLQEEIIGKGYIE